MPQKWGIWFSVEGDLRFASHHDMLRLVARLTARSGLPVKFSQGYNPRPALSLAWPRPVGVATRCDLLVATLDSANGSGVGGEADLPASLAAGGPPEGLRFLRAERLERKRAVLPGRIDYERPLTGELAGAVRARLDELASMESWPAERLTRASGDPRRAEGAAFDIRPFVAGIRVEGGMLRWGHVPCRGKWARPAELLALLEMKDRADVASVTRTGVEMQHGN